MLIFWLGHRKISSKGVRGSSSYGSRVPSLLSATSLAANVEKSGIQSKLKPVARRTGGPSLFGSQAPVSAFGFADVFSFYCKAAVGDPLASALPTQRATKEYVRVGSASTNGSALLVKELSVLAHKALQGHTRHR